MRNDAIFCSKTCVARHHDRGVGTGGDQRDDGDREGESAQGASDGDKECEHQHNRERDHQRAAEGDDLCEGERALDAEEPGPREDRRSDREQQRHEDPEQAQHSATL